MGLGFALRGIENETKKNTSESLPSASQANYTKRTIIHSPIFVNIFPNFNVDIAKPFKGVPSNSIDESDQYLVPKIDSQMDAFSDDDDDFSILGGNGNSNTSIDGGGIASATQAPKPIPELVSMKVIVKLTSILINEVEYALPAPLRSSCLVPGERDPETNMKREDSILVSLKSGYLLLIRIYLVARSSTDKFYEQQDHPIKSTNLIFKPYIVQWWDTSQEQMAASIESSGSSLHAHSSGHSVVSTSASNVFRIYNTHMTENGMVLGPHTNVPVEGVILHACFSEPLADCEIDTHKMFLTLVFTDTRRLEINLYEWNSHEPITGCLQKKTLPLNNSFTIPIFIIPLRNNASFLFVCEHELIIVSIHHIMSVEYDFYSHHIDISFPTSFYCPLTSIRNDAAEEKMDEILLATDNGTIYSITVRKNEDISIIPVARISDPVSVFAMEHINSEEYSLIFGSDTGSNREVHINELFTEESIGDSQPEKKIPYSSTRTINDYKNWAPLLDAEIINSIRSRNINNYTDQELWALAGTGKRTRLMQLRSGYLAHRLSKTFADLRKATNIFFHKTPNNEYYFILSFAFQTRVFEYFDDAEDDAEVLVEVKDIQLQLEDSTLQFGSLLNNTIIQVTENSVFVSNLVDEPIGTSFDSKRIISSHLYYNNLLLVSEDDELNYVIEVLQFDINSIRFDEGMDMLDIANIDFQLLLNFEPSMAKLIEINDTLVLVIGSFDGIIKIYSLQSNQLVSEFYLNAHNPYKQGDLNQQLTIPHDVLIRSSKGTYYLSIGSKDGFYITFKFESSMENLVCDQFLKISDTSVSFQDIAGDEMLFCILSRNLWLVNLYESKYPEKAFFSENTDKAIVNMVQIQPDDAERDLSSSLKFFGFLREDGFSIGSVTTTRSSNTKHVNIGEPARKLKFLPYISTFAILCNSKSPRSRLKFIDRKSLKTLSHREFNKYKSTDGEASIIKEREFPTSICIWSIKRSDNRVSKKILVGFSTETGKGSLKVLDISLDGEESATDIVVTELNSFEWKEPITCIQQIESTIFFSSGSTLNTTSYNISERRLNPVNTLASFSSPIVSLNVYGSEILVTTKSDSVLQFTYQKQSLGQEKIQLIAKDPSPKSLVNEAQFGDQIVIADKLHSSILLMDKRDDVLQNVFSYKMSSIPRVFAARFRSIWSENDHQDEGLAVVCIGVNGTVTILQKESDSPTSTDELNLPFEDKLNGKGLFSLYKPFFNFRENRGTLIDYDLDAVAKSGAVNVLL
ncbi:hypothetical protein CAAN1_04S04830 [[Candida] anglica]|uniref:RSE1/DDB1/CPSF1 first beta-propeller domain-containing protein n=1 Tax=[Candida] anglica TaxID=148631 RepID=A0ABP0ED17_9ASCO